MTEENRSGPEFPGVSKTGRDATLHPTQLANKFARLEKRACAVGIEVQVVGRKVIDNKDNTKL